MTYLTDRGWESFGYIYIGTKAGKPFSSKIAALKKLSEINGKELVKVEGGYRVKAGVPMSKQQASEFKERFDNDPRRGYPRGIASKNHKPLCVTNPELFDKYSQALHVLGLHYWQRPYQEIKHRVPKTKWLDARRRNGLLDDSVGVN